MRPERVIRHGRVEPNHWTLAGVDTAAGAALPAGPVAVDLATWQATREELRARREPVGVWLKADDDPEALAADLGALALVAVQFPKFGDGRGFSIATLLRTRLGYKGELRAFGDVGRDHLFYLKRCGFDAFSLPAHRDLEAALDGLHDFSLVYQAGVDGAQPLFRRRLQEAGSGA